LRLRELYAAAADFSRLAGARLSYDRTSSTEVPGGAVVSEIILHHYPLSPFAEKTRVALGIKGLAWRSVIIPQIMPKPELMPLTGGYRKTPVMQIGADIYCDTQCILRELERRFPEPSFYRGTDAGTANGLAWWSERSVFSPAVGVVFGARADMVPQAFLDDRSKMTGRELRVDRLKAATPMLLDQLRPQFGWFDAMLADGRPFVTGQFPTLVDCSIYNPCWFVRKNLGADAAPINEWPRLLSWMDRVAAIGHGTPTDLSASAALEIAKAAQPQVTERTDANDPFKRKPGMKVQVMPDDTGKDPVAGELIASSADEIVIRRVDPLVGEVAVHFPRAGFIVQPAG
jgi:glutathione S-transferase